ncbi:uncharacterized protein LOC111113913 isoform X1 [Crassostrea virginica]
MTLFFQKLFFQFLKKKFCGCPWINLKDEEFMRECKRHIGDDPYKFKTMCSYASHKFTQMRNQLRRQIFHSTLDVQGLSLDGLSSFLFKAFIPPGQSPLDDQVRRMTVVIVRLVYLAVLGGA